MFKRIPILCYHSVGPILKDWNRNFLTMRVGYFEKQLQYIRKNFNVISISDYYNIKNGNQTAPINPIVITFDDGFLDNWIWAFPLLKKYKFRATIFVSPEMVDTSGKVRPNAEDLWNGKVNESELNVNGYLSWEELILMEKSGYIDIQSHTMSHTKYFVSGKIIGFHQPGADCLYPVGNLYKERKPFHIHDKEFEKLMPYGTPFFEERSAIIAKRIFINPAFTNECVAALKNYDFSNYSFSDTFGKIKPVYDSYQKNNSLIEKTESEQEYKERLNYEITDSKKILETKLGKKIEFLCWPHGDSNLEAHEVAIKNGYKATTIGNSNANTDDKDRIGVRFAFKPFLNSERLGILKTEAKIKEFTGSSSARIIKKIYRLFKS